MYDAQNVYDNSLHSTQNFAAFSELMNARKFSFQKMLSKEENRITGAKGENDFCKCNIL